MTRTRRSPVTASDVRRMGGQPLDLVIAATWLGYASNVPTVAKPLAEMLRDAIGKSDPCGSDPCAVKLSERGAKALAKLCEAAGRVNTAAAIRAAVKAALAPPKELTPLEHLDSLAAEGALEPHELEQLRRIMGGPSDKGGLFGG